MRSTSYRCLEHVRVDSYDVEVQYRVRLPPNIIRSKLSPQTINSVLNIFLQPVPWVPMDVIGQAYVEWVTTTETLPFLVNVVHPRPTTWEVVLEHVRSTLGSDLQSVRLRDWVQELEERAASASLEELAQIVRHLPFQATLSR